MARRSEPWYWSARRGWYVQINGKQIPLGKAEKKTSTPPVEVQMEWHRLMAVEGKLDGPEMKRSTVPELIEVFLASKSRCRDSTLRKYQYILGPFAKRYEKIRVSDLRPRDVTDFCDSMETWGDSSRFTCCALVKQAWEFGRDRGYSDVNALAGMDNPYHIPTRDHAMTEAEYLLVRNLARDDNWKLLVDVLWFTGARPGEVCKIEARHLHPIEAKATLAANEHKTGSKSKRSRVIYFPDEIMAALRAMAEARPEGPLLRNTVDTPWTNIAISCRIMRWRRLGKIPAGLVLYTARHGFVTRKINEGHTPSLVAKAVGHANTRVTEGVYYNPASDRLGQVAQNDIRKAVEAEISRSGSEIDVDSLVKSIVESVIAKMCINPVKDSSNA
jgi:integrase